MIITLTDLKRYFNLDDAPVSITGDGTWATVSHPSHGFKPGDYVEFSDSTNFNSVYLITARPDANSYKFKSAIVASNEFAVVKKHDFILTPIIDQVHSYIKHYCGLEYGNTASASEIKDLERDGVIYPSRGFINSVSEIRLSLTQDFSTSDEYKELVVADDCFIYEDRIELKKKSIDGYAPSLKSVKITYTCQSAPAALKFAAMQLAEFHYRNYNDKNINKLSTVEGNSGTQSTYQKNIPQTILDALEPFKRYSIGS